MQSLPLTPVRIVLVGTTHPGNIGAAARAMKTMGLSRLFLVAPKQFPSADASARASGADDVLYAATVCDSLDDALVGCGWVVGASARIRHLGWPELDSRETAEQALTQAQKTDVAIIFGRENSGLTNEELERCHAMVRIPTAPGYGSLNLAAAVQVIAYDLFVAVGRHQGDAPAMLSASPATAEEMSGFYQHLEQALIDIGYLDPAAPKHLMRRLRRLYNRAGIDESELNILRGILASAQKSASGER